MPKIFEWIDGEAVISADFAFMMFTQHGMPVEILEEVVNEKLPPHSSERALEVARAYDEAHETKFAEELVEIINNKKI